MSETLFVFNNEYLADLIKQSRRVNEEIKEELGQLSPQQFNWKPAAGVWSVGQCIDHIRTTLLLYVPLFEALKENRKPSNFWEKIPFLPGMWGKLLIGMTAPVPKRKAKTIPAMEPASSDISLRVIDDFIRAQEQLLTFMQDLDHLDHRKTIITSPAGKFITYPLGDVFILLVNHPERHLNQARNVMSLEAFQAIG